MVDTFDKATREGTQAAKYMYCVSISRGRRTVLTLYKLNSWGGGGGGGGGRVLAIFKYFCLAHLVHSTLFCMACLNFNLTNLADPMTPVIFSTIS